MLISHHCLWLSCVLWLFSILSLTISHCLSEIKGASIRCTSDVLLFCSYSYIYICFCFGTLWRTERCLYNRVRTDFYNHHWVVACKRRARRLSAWRRGEEFEHVLCVPSATRSSPCSTASPATWSWWRPGTLRPKCWTGTASTWWSVSRETSTLWIWPTPRWAAATHTWLFNLLISLFAMISTSQREQDVRFCRDAKNRG